MTSTKNRPIKARDMMSGKKLVGVVIGCLVLSCVIFLIPSLKMSFAVEANLAIGIWWLTWVCILTKILYQGWRIEDDRLSGLRGDPSNKSHWWDVFDLAGYGEGLGGIIVGFIISIIFALFSYLLIELLLPLFAWLAYSLVLKMLRTAAHDRHDCKKNILLSAVYAIFWSTLYVLPLILCIYFVQYFSGNTPAPL